MPYLRFYTEEKKQSDDIIESVINSIKKQTLNVVLVGMPGAGKTTVGKMVANLLGKEFIDTDLLIEQRENKKIAEIFKSNGEEYFRKIESELLSKVGVLSGKVISTGGGVVKNKDNYFSLKQNGVIIWIDRNLDELASEGRPLSKDKETIKKLYNERKDSYALFADGKIINDGDLDLIAKGVKEFYENFSD